MSSPVQESEHTTSSTPDPGTIQNNEPSSSVTDSDSDNSDKSVPETTRPSFYLKMMIICKEFTIMVLLGVIYAALTSESPPKVSKSPAAYPFFPQDSLIRDWYKGQITQAIEEARASDIAFVMFYAPWDAESQNVRKELDFTAKYMYEKVTFAAVNCWQPGSECRRQYSKVYKWPVLIAYPTHGRGIQYNGPFNAFHMIKFLQNMCHPIIKGDNLLNLMGKHNVVISANIYVLPGSFEYAVFYSTALRFLERDPFRDTVFTVIPQNYEEEPRIMLHNWNETLEYDGEWNPDSLINWIVANSRHVTSWVAPTGMKSLNFASSIQPGPTLILFTPKNPITRDTDYYNMLRVVAYDYHNCANGTYITTRLNLVKQERSRNGQAYQSLKTKCLARQKPRVVTNLPNIWSNTTAQEICNCGNTDLRTACPESETVVTVADRLSPLQLQKTVKEETCRDVLLAERYSPVILERRGLDEGVNVSGLACTQNSSLKFVALNSLKYGKIAERLGVDLGKLEDKSGVVIVNEKMETHHVMNANVTSKNLRLFVYNFTRENVARSMRSKIHIKNGSQLAYQQLNCEKTSYFCLPELNSENFLQTILQRNKVVLVFYYSKQCSFCNGVGYIFLTVAKLLAAVDDVIFTRIDGDANLLPWEYTMEGYPTILFLPAKRKSESRTFPKNLPITVPNVLGFILTNVDPVLRLKTTWSVCCQSKFTDEKDECMKSVRMEMSVLIGKTLKEWRNSTRKQKVLYKLQLLKQLHLLFAHNPDEVVEIKRYLSKLRG